ncbi:hypothetical protein [Marinicella litoralis]|uniref:Uncharacterized protein n=1 Tax=Marinicella litoralis TaxID=644220 RepID=A0A4R6XJA7_9GAMM|nr:hypothetical protein [Marinicella litoralis]TDR19596.1 hypothetical protein C8D91_2153 [Marinicella litoralis]
MNKSYIVLGQFLITLLTLATANQSMALTVSFSDSQPLNLYDEVQYHLSVNEVDFFVGDPVICHTKLGLPVSGLAAVVTDANSGPGTILPISESIQYDVPSQTILANVNSKDAACVTPNGKLFADVIFSSDFDSVTAFTVEYVNLPDLVVLDQTLDYNIIIQNLSNQELVFDVLEYVSEVSIQNTAYFSGLNVSWDCVNEFLPDVDCGSSIADRYGARSVILQPGEFADILVSRTVSTQSVLNQTIDMMTAVFVKNQAGDFIDVKSIDKQLEVVENEAPQLSWINSTLNTFLEDDTIGQVLSFRIEDGSGANFSAATLEQAILSYNNKVEFSNITVQEVVSGVYDVSFTVMPQADKFTDSQNSEFISIQVSDIFNVYSNTLILEVAITPVNDAPSFDVSCTHLILDPSPLNNGSDVICASQVGNANTQRSGVYTWDDFLINVSPGPYENQSISFELTNVTGDAIIDDLVIGSNMSDLWLLMQDGASGTAVINLQATDNGDTLNNGENQFELPTDITIELLPVTYTISGVANDFPTIDPASEITVRLSVGGDVVDLEVDANNANDFIFGYQLADGASYTVQIIGQTLANCSITNGASGTISGSNVTDLVIDCGL